MTTAKADLRIPGTGTYANGHPTTLGLSPDRSAWLQDSDQLPVTRHPA
jgi:hypothetical protein